MKSQREYQVCTRCVMDTSDQEITFDADGVCNHCTEYFELAKVLIPDPEEARRRYEAMMNMVIDSGKGKEYDCVVGLSGGVDSSYVAYLAKEAGLRALTVHFDNGWNSELAVKNIENIVNKTGFDYQTNVVDWEEFKDLQIAFLKASVANAETPTDHAFLAAIYKLCKQYNIKYNLNGSNFATEGILPDSWGYNSKDVKHLKAIHKQFGNIKLKTYPLLGFRREFYYTYFKGVKNLRPLNLVGYKKMEAMEVLKREFGWKYYGGKHYESTFTKFFQAYILPTKFGYDKRRAHLSSLICNNEITREEAVKELSEPLYQPNELAEDREYVCKKLGLSDQEFEQIMDTPGKSHTAYPNSEERLKRIYRIYYKLRGRDSNALKK